ncbi:MAG: hypothetical protein Q8R82_21865 [Hyphomonadaceae bacterium]|nr:hypothetical protein [Hyphomonadaceae bacterium]
MFFMKLAARLRDFLLGARRDGGAADAPEIPYELNHVRPRTGKIVIPYRSSPDTSIEVFWKDFRKPKPGRDAVLENGVGPVISFILNGRELARFDCLGENGHFHLALMRPDAGVENRLWLHERTTLAQVERAIFELRRNVNYYRQRNPVAEVRSGTLDPAEHDICCSQALSAAIGLMESKLSVLKVRA